MNLDALSLKKLNKNNKFVDSTTIVNNNENFAKLLQIQRNSIRIAKNNIVNICCRIYVDTLKKIEIFKKY